MDAEKQPMDPRWVEKIFKRLKFKYTAQWTALIGKDGDEWLEHWGEELAGLSAEQVKKGLKMLDSEWPPSADAFAKLCKGGGDWEHSGDAYKAYDHSKALGLPNDAIKKLGYGDDNTLTAAEKKSKEIREREWTKQFVILGFSQEEAQAKATRADALSKVLSMEKASD